MTRVAIHDLIRMIKRYNAPRGHPLLSLAISSDSSSQARHLLLRSVEYTALVTCRPNFVQLTYGLASSPASPAQPGSRLPPKARVPSQGLTYQPGEAKTRKPSFYSTLIRLRLFRFTFPLQNSSHPTISLVENPLSYLIVNCLTPRLSFPRVMRSAVLSTE